MLAAALLQGCLLLAAVGVRTVLGRGVGMRTNARDVLAQFFCTATSRLRSQKWSELAHFKTLAFRKPSLKGSGTATAANPLI